MLALQYKKTDQSLAYFWRLIDVQKNGKMTLWTINYFFREMMEKIRQNKMEPAKMEDVRDEIFGILIANCVSKLTSKDMVKPSDPNDITLKDLKQCKIGFTVVTILSDVNGFWAYDNRESIPLTDEE
jgi:hypothetical protein